MTVLMRYTSGVISAGEQGYLNKDNGTKKKVFFFLCCTISFGFA